MFYHLNISRKQADDVLIKYSSSIWTEDRIKKEKKEVMKLKMKIFQLLSQNFGTQKIIEFFKTFIDNENLMNLALSKIEPYKDQSKEFRKLFERMKAI